MQRLDRLKNLISMAAIDGSLTEREIKLLMDRSIAMQISEHDFSKAMAEALSPEAVLTIPPNHEERVSVLRDLLRMMAADGMIAEDEKHMFATVAARMEISSAELNDIIDSTLPRPPE